MISICIPIYNYDASHLLTDLIFQIDKLTVACEIIVIDDGSLETNKQWNRPIHANCRYVELKENIGRSKIRNLFLEYANYEYLLFLDCDSLILNDNFIANYIHSVKNHSKYHVFCGGRIYREQKPERNKLLRWKYGICRESQPLKIREQHPNTSFMTNNFLIQKILFTKHQFDERISTYGHEDTLFGFVLKKNEIPIKHVNNPILNGHIETNDEYLDKTEKAVKNLVLILQNLHYDSEFIASVSLLKFQQKLQSKKWIPLVTAISLLCNPLIKKMLSLGYVNLYCFDFFKLGVFLAHKKR